MRDDNKLSNNSWMQFAPRIGLAFDPSGDGRMTIRAAYGIFFDYPHLYQFNGFRSQPPFENRVTRTRVPNSFGDPWVGYPGGNPFPFVADENAPFAPGATARGCCVGTGHDRGVLCATLVTEIMWTAWLSCRLARSFSRCLGCASARWFYMRFDI